MAFKEIILNTETQRVKIYQEDKSTLILQVIEIEDSSSIRLYMDKELTKELIQELSNELTKLHY
jgi:hypothetical protein